MSSTSLTDLVGQSSPIPDIESNINVQPLETIKKYAGVPHGMSMVALCIMDGQYRGLEMDIKFDSEMYMNSFVEHLISVWANYEPISSFIRSYKKDGKFVKEFDGNTLQESDTVPASTEEFKNKKVIIDMSTEGDDKYTFRLYRWNEVRPRILRLSVKPVVESP